MVHNSSLSLEQKEQTRHGEHMFPLKKYITTLTDLYPSVSPHWHDEAELTLITNGSCTYQVQLDTYEVEEGDLLFVSPAVLHSIIASSRDDSRALRHMNFLGANSADICAVKYLTPVTNQSLILPCLIRKGHPAYGDILNLFRRISNTYDNISPGYELLLRALLLQVIVALLPYSNEQVVHSPLETEHTFKLKLVLEYIGEHYAEELTIPQLARICYFSEYHFMRFFKKYTGTSCLEYIKNLRLEKACRTVCSGERSLSWTLHCLWDFRIYPIFTGEFKKKYGMTPRKFIENIPYSRALRPYRYQ